MPQDFVQNLLVAKYQSMIFFGLNILISQNGDLNIHLKFDDIASLKKFEQDSDKLLDDLRKSFVFKENKVAGVYAYSYEKEAVSTGIEIDGPALVRN